MVSKKGISMVEIIDNLTMLQSGLNEVITHNWRENRTELDFMIASHMEMSELIDTTYEENGSKYSMGWKWWKGKNGERTMDSVDWSNLHPGVKNNIIIELTDLVFFTLSQKVLGDFSEPDEIVELHENDWINFMAITANNLLQRPGTALKHIILLADKIGFNIAAYYVAKLTLNLVRQSSGYKDGSYKKVVDGKEDNELLHDVIDGITIDAFEENFELVTNNIMQGVYKIFGMENSSENKDYASLKIIGGF